ncbi:MAG: hypothetical protein PHC60_07505 [Heliobacteriaceae bacterium]|nr:hypothetical protein [Heliobacteriaceae bacterium]MDD4588215.1 hypothetical protein [Heliobacteriaceae bacterium]
MFSGELYFALLSVAAGLLTLLGSTGIFVSLVVQRRLERLQDILEEFLELPYAEKRNLSVPMINLVRKYQMHYLFPDRPGKSILFFLNFTLGLVLFIWAAILLTAPGWPPRPLSWLQLLLFAMIALNIYLFRRLLQHTVNPTGTPLFNPIIPPPHLLRSVSYLSRYVTVSVKLILGQARFALAITADGTVYLKQELSFDDFYYLLFSLAGEFAAWGELRLHFPPDPITKKPVPMQRNIEIPLGSLSPENQAALYGGGPVFPLYMLVFPRGEKHPIQYEFFLEQFSTGFHSRPFPEATVQPAVTYQVSAKQLVILENSGILPGFTSRQNFPWNGERYYRQVPETNPCLCTTTPQIG